MNIPKNGYKQVLIIEEGDSMNKPKNKYKGL